ncbi:hypothetical protein [Streptomyces sp. G1]|uniref:hypothetical protein n=1 Tax=Streptomyces sp. G1 TaxID=361572 RepID=UPI00202DE62B|nr:hypothetical protein [Streptomyces sp. G1]MCM1965128.1 hypothetical protein [Streptomyces sp. G1]
MPDAHITDSHNEVDSGPTAEAHTPQADAEQEDLGLVIDVPEGFDKPAAATSRSTLMDQGQS